MVRGHLLNTGIKQEVRKPGKLPMKIPGKHRWIAMLAYKMTDEKAKGLLYGTDNKLDMDKENLAEFSFGCIDCEVELTKGSFNRRCPAKAFEL